MEARHPSNLISGRQTALEILINQRSKVMSYRFRLKQQKGLTLIEIMVAISILVVAYIGIVQAYPFGLAVNKESGDSTIASYLCQGKLEEVISLGYDNIITGTIEAKARLSADPTDNLYNFQRQTTVAYVDGSLNDSVSDLGMKKISVTVYYVNALTKKEKSYNITTLISRR